MLFVDDRWARSTDGIGRFSREVLARLSLPWAPLPAAGKPARATDVLVTSRFRLTSDDTLYSPGFNAGVTRARQVITVHDLIHLHDPHERSRAKVAYYERIVRPAIRRAGVVLTVSSTSAEMIRTWLDDDRIRVVSVGNGCSSAFGPDGDAAVLGEGTFLAVGCSKPHRNLGVALGALRLRPDYRLHVVSSDADGMWAWARRLGVESQVSIESNVSDARLAALYRGATALVMPSTMEGFGLPALEAMRCGTPVIHWVECAAINEIVDGAGIEITSAHDHEAWAAGLDAATERPAASVSPEWAHRYCWDAVAQRVEFGLTS